MPVLALEQSVFPHDLLDTLAVEDTRRQWWVIYTKARQEKALVRQLGARDVPCYLPLIPQENFSRGWRTCSHLPVFAGYVFLFGDEDERIKTLKTNRVSRMLPVPDGEQLRADLCRVRDLIDLDGPVTVERRLEPGQQVRIKRGSLAGLEGTIIQRRNTTRLLIAVRYLQQGISIQIDDFMVEPL
jgi:transcription antitermination factor NusG